jgi:hypothetical protein
MTSNAALSALELPADLQAEDMVQFQARLGRPPRATEVTRLRMAARGISETSASNGGGTTPSSGSGNRRSWCSAGVHALQIRAGVDQRGHGGAAAMMSA